MSNNTGGNVAVLAMLREAGDAGITTADVVRHLELDDKAAGAVLYNLGKTGRVVREVIGTGRSHALSRYRLAPGDDGMPVDRSAVIRAGFERNRAGKPPAAAPKPKQPPPEKHKPMLAKKPSGAALDPKAPAIIPPTVKVTVAPPFKDARYTFEAPPGWKGEITRDWLQRRLESRA